MVNQVYLVTIEDLVADFKLDKYSKHTKCKSSTLSVTHMNKIVNWLPTVEIYVTNNNQIIKNYDWLKQLSQLLLTEVNLKGFFYNADLHSISTESTHHIALYKVYDNSKLYDLVKFHRINKDFRLVDKLRAAYWALHNYQIPVWHLKEENLDVELLLK